MHSLTPRRTALRWTSLFTLLALLAACDNAAPVDNDPPPPPPPATTGTVTGNIALPPGTNGSTANTRVALYANVDDWAADRFAYQVGADGSGNYTVANVVPGTYYMDAWKDNNNNGVIDGGDFFGVYGSITTSGNANLTPVPVAAGQTVTIPILITPLPTALHKQGPMDDE